MQPFPEGEKGFAPTPLRFWLRMNLAGVKGTLANFSPDPLPDLSVSPSVSTRFVALSDLDLGCGEKEEEKGASVRPSVEGKQELEELP